MNNSPRRVVITGIGAITPLGLNFNQTWAAALEGRSGMAPITLFDLGECPVHFAAEVKGFNPSSPIGPIHLPDGIAESTKIEQILSTKESRKIGRFCHFAVASGLEAYLDSGLNDVRNQISPERMGINIGVGMGGLPEIEAVHQDLLNKGYRRVTPFLIPQIIPNLASGQLSIMLGLQGPNLCNVTACSSSAHSIGESFHIIRRGDAEVMMTGGAESVISPLGIAGFASMRALSTRNDAPTRASRPFDTDRDGFVMGEGGATLVLEEYEFAKKRGARIYGEILGYGLSGDAYHMTLPAPEGQGGYRAMRMALQNSGLAAEQIGYINAHGTSTPAGDAEEIKAIAKLFPNGKSHLAVTSSKSMTGHLLGAAGALEALFSLKVIQEGSIPPTINLDHPDPACQQTGFNFVPHEAIRKKVDYALSNSFGFGGTNASLIIGKAP